MFISKSAEFVPIFAQKVRIFANFLPLFTDFCQFFTKFFLPILPKPCKLTPHPHFSLKNNDCPKITRNYLPKSPIF